MVPAGPTLRLLVLSDIDDWDFGRRLKDCGHNIVAWARPKWKQGPKRGALRHAIRTTVRAILCLPRPRGLITPQFDAWKWLDKEKIPRIPCPNVNDPKFVEYVKGLNIDLIAVYFFSQILKPAILQTPRLGVINCHPSLLPRYGGPHPAFWMLKNGESVAGVTVHVMTEGIDTGAIVAQQELPIGENETNGQLTQRQHRAATTLLTEAVNAMAQGTTAPKPQNIAERSYFGKMKAADTIVDWNGSAKQIANLWRALQPYEPLAACLNGITIKIFDAHPQEGPPSGRAPGEIMSKQSGKLLVQTGNGYFEIRSYEIEPFHGWINRLLQTFLLPVGSRFDHCPVGSGAGI
ncbi:MAG: Methionyl-tRNA formyltransferase [Nitrospira sp.]|jgi:methionyl-tRNA formyltransferase|nr:Methionyl-tRNA formyltransferase [Nitrospira sp.]